MPSLPFVPAETKAKSECRTTMHQQLGFQDSRMSWLFPYQLSRLNLHNFGSLEECPFLRIVYTRSGGSWCCASQFQCVFYLSPCPAREFSCARSVHWRKFCHPPSQQIFWPTTVGADVPWLGFASPAWRSAKWANRQPDKKLENGVHETLPLADSLDLQLKLWLNLIHCSVILGHAQVESSRLVSWWSRERLISAAKWWYWRFRFFHTIWSFELAYASLWRAEILNPGCFAITLPNFLKLSLVLFAAVTWATWVQSTASISELCMALLCMALLSGSQRSYLLRPHIVVFLNKMVTWWHLNQFFVWVVGNQIIILSADFERILWGWQSSWLSCRCFS